MLARPRAPERARARDQSARQPGHDRIRERLLRRLNDGDDDDGAPIASGPIWLGYYRSENEGASFVSSLVPGYPGDTSTLGALAKIRTASAGDPVAAWDAEGRVFMGSESSDDPAGSKKTFGDEWVARYVNPGGPDGDTINDGSRFAGSVVVAKGSSAPNLLGKFHDKTAIEADRTDSCMPRQRVLRLVALHGQRRRRASTSSARPITASRSRSR